MRDGTERAMRIGVSTPRRLLAVAVLLALAGLLGALAAGPGPLAAAWRGGLGLAALAGLGLSWRLWAMTAGGLVLDEGGLCEAGGRPLCRWDEIRRLERGGLAFRPAGGFVLHLAAPGRAAWRPGLWWRLGRRLGVGGLIAPLEARLLAEAIELRLEPRGR